MIIMSLCSKKRYLLRLVSWLTYHRSMKTWDWIPNIHIKACMVMHIFSPREAEKIPWGSWLPNLTKWQVSSSITNFTL